MRSSVLWRKIARLIVMISDNYDISGERALALFYKSNVYRMLKDPKYGYQTMSDLYLLEEFRREMQHQN